MYCSVSARTMPHTNLVVRCFWPHYVWISGDCKEDTAMSRQTQRWIIHNSSFQPDGTLPQKSVETARARHMGLVVSDSCRDEACIVVQAYPVRRVRCNAEHGRRIRRSTPARPQKDYFWGWFTNKNISTVSLNTWKHGPIKYLKTYVKKGRDNQSTTWWNRWNFKKNHLLSYNLIINRRFWIVTFI